jgi:ribA/ribD-fused uncharacterized protein
MIDSFDGKYAFLSNFFPSPIKDAGITYPTVEHYFQAMKSLDMQDRYKIAAAPSPGQAKRLGRKVSLRPNWNKIKDDIMYIALWEKFSDPVLRDALLATNDEELIEGNWWNDTYWGVCNGIGENHLGRLLMIVRKNIRELNHGNS